MSFFGIRFILFRGVRAAFPPATGVVWEFELVEHRVLTRNRLPANCAHFVLVPPAPDKHSISTTIRGQMLAEVFNLCARNHEKPRRARLLLALQRPRLSSISWQSQPPYPIRHLYTARRPLFILSSPLSIVRRAFPSFWPRRFSGNPSKSSHRAKEKPRTPCATSEALTR